MYVRVFSVRPMEALDKYFNFMKAELKPSGWKVDYCDPMKWSPNDVVADINIHIDFPLRLGTPWARFNVFAADAVLTKDSWIRSDMDLVVTAMSLTDRDSATSTLRRIFTAAAKSKRPAALPLDMNKDALPKVGIITLTRNRKDWWPNMLQNVVKQNWPVDRMEWIIVDDGDENQKLREEVDIFMEKSPGVMIRYVEMEKPRSIGAKRNAAVEQTPNIDIFVVMDDDDHYPPNSIAKRVAWLNRALPEKVPQAQIGFCTVLPVYDLTRYISAMSVADIAQDPGERLSEATLIFTRAAWEARPFPDVSMAEGDGFVADREAVTVEIPPKEVIVSFIHARNTSFRRIPADQEPNGCHFGFSDEYFSYVHTIGSKK
jgi:hypothetical protein